MNEQDIIFKGIHYPSLRKVREIPTSFSIRDWEGGKPIPDLIKQKFDGIRIISYRGVNLPPSAETYCHARVLGRLLKSLVAQNNLKPLVVADVGTGSGLIAITLAKQLGREIEEGECKVVAADISGDALEVASLNIAINDVKVQLRKRDMLDGLVGEFGKLDVIVSNPPYHETNSVDPLFVANFVPRLAIDGGSDGMDFYRTLFEQAKSTLSDEGIIFIQHPSGKVNTVRQIVGSTMPGRVVEHLSGRSGVITASVVFSPEIKIMESDNFEGGDK